MKKSMLILILTALLSACGESENTPEKAEIFTFQTTQITSVTTTESAERKNPGRTASFRTAGGYRDC